MLTVPEGGLFYNGSFTVKFPFPKHLTKKWTKDTSFSFKLKNRELRNHNKFMYRQSGCNSWKDRTHLVWKWNLLSGRFNNKIILSLKNVPIVRGMGACVKLWANYFARERPLRAARNGRG
jgi:hypothetical protein